MRAARKAGALAALVLLAAPVPVAAQDGTRPPAPLEIPAILERTPDSLPRAAPERWKGYAAEEAPEVAREHVTRLERAAAFYRARRYPGALTELFALLEAEPDFPDALMILGTTYFRMRRYGDAAVAFERALERAPVLVGRTQALAHCYYTLGDYAGARDHYGRVLAAEPDSHEARRGLALAHLRLGEDERARELLTLLVEERPDFGEARYWLARVLYDGVSAESAREHARRAIELQPHDVRSWFLWMQVLEELGEEEEAREAEAHWRDLDGWTQELRRLEAILVNHPERFDLWGRTVELHRRMGNAAGARSGLDRLIETRPPERSELELLIFALDVLVSLGDEAGARYAAGLLEERCGDELGAWRRLEIYFATTRDRPGQVRAGRRRRELEAAGEGG